MKLTPAGHAIIEGDTYLSAEIEREGRLDVQSARDLLHPLRQHIPAGGVVVDVGASLGDTAATFAEMVGVGGIVHVYEPQFDSFTCLLHNLGLSELSAHNTRCHCLALGDRDRRVTFEIDTNNIGASRLVPVPNATPDAAIVTTLDRNMEACGVDRLDFLKIDAEGWEPLILDGAVATITKFRPAMLIEVNDWPLGKMGFDRYSIFSRLDALGYHYENFDGPYGDILCLPREKWVQARD